MIKNYYMFYLLILAVNSVLTDRIYALEVTTKYEFYYIDPKDVGDINKEIGKKGLDIEVLNRGRASATYNHTLNFWDQLSYKQNGNRCHVVFNEPHLYSTITIFQLEPNKQYDPSIVDEYKKKFNNTKKHELKHEAIYREGYTQLEKDIRMLIKSGHANCFVLRDQIENKFNHEYKQIKRKNREFDCEDYGYHGKEKMCNTFLRANVTAHSDPNKKTCDGELVEAFKGKFYCITGEYTK